MERIPILQMGEFLLVTIQVDMHDQLALTLQDDLSERISKTSARGVLIDMARHRGKEVLDKGETFTHLDLLDAAAAQGVTIEKRDVLLIRTGWIGSFYKRGADDFYKDFIEPGLTFSRELVEWFHEMEIPNLVTDTIANEVTIDPVSGVALPPALAWPLVIAETAGGLAILLGWHGRWASLALLPILAACKAQDGTANTTAPAEPAAPSSTPATETATPTEQAPAASGTDAGKP